MLVTFDRLVHDRLPLFGGQAGVDSSVLERAHESLRVQPQVEDDSVEGAGGVEHDVPGAEAPVPAINAKLVRVDPLSIQIGDVFGHEILPGPAFWVQVARD